MPTQAQFEEWDAIARSIQGDRELIDCSEAEKATIVSVRSMGPGAAMPWVQENTTFMNPGTVAITENGPVDINKLELSPYQAEYYAKLGQQFNKDARDATALLTKAQTMMSAAVAASPGKYDDDVPETLGVAGTTLVRSTGASALVLRAAADAPALVETRMAPGAGASSSLSVPTVTGKGTAIVVVIIVIAIAIALGWVTIPRTWR